MAQSPSHRFGQIIGDTLELAIKPVLEIVAKELGFFLDGKGERKVRGKKRKVAWVDGQGNSHDLDYVFEFGGSEEVLGTPRAFVEIAWRRYTKHSRNKAQEIQGAILPLVERYSDCHPFLGVVLGGVFTAGSLNQLRSHGFTVLHFPYESIIEAFAKAGIDAFFDETTTDASLLRRVRKYDKLSASSKDAIAESLRATHRADLGAFASALKLTLTRTIKTIYVLPLHGEPRVLPTVDGAIAFLQSFDESMKATAFVRYEVGVRYSNDDEVRGQFNDKDAAIAFLRAVC